MLGSYLMTPDATPRPVRLVPRTNDNSGLPVSSSMVERSKLSRMMPTYGLVVAPAQIDVSAVDSMRKYAAFVPRFCHCANGQTVSEEKSVSNQLSAHLCEPVRACSSWFQNVHVNLVTVGVKFWRRC